MISLIMSLFASMTHTVANMLHSNKDQNANKMPITRNVASSSNKHIYTKTNNNPITVIKPGALSVAAESGSHTVATNGVTQELHPTENKASPNKDSEEPSGLSQYDDYAKNITDLKRKIEINRLKAEMYKSSIDYEDPGSYDQATMIGVVVDPRGFKSAHIKLIDDTTTDLMIGSRLGQYIVSDIGVNAVTLINAKCRKHKKARKFHNKHKHSKHNSDNTDIVVHTDTENKGSSPLDEANPLICKPVKIYPLYRDLNNRLPVNNSSSRTIGPNGTRVYNNGVQSTTNAGLSTNSSMMNAAGAAGSGGTSISSGGMTLTIPPIETGPHGN